MTWKCDCFEGLVGFMRTATLTFIGMSMYMILEGVFAVKGITNPGRAIIHTLLCMDTIALIFTCIFFCFQNKTACLINAAAYILTFTVEVGVMLGYGVYIYQNREREGLTGCPVCGDATVYARFFFTSAVTMWFLINLPFKIASCRNCIWYYNKKYKNSTRQLL